MNTLQYARHTLDSDTKRTRLRLSEGLPRRPASTLADLPRRPQDPDPHLPINAVRRYCLHTEHLQNSTVEAEFSFSMLSLLHAGVTGPRLVVAKLKMKVHSLLFFGSLASCCTTVAISAAVWTVGGMVEQLEQCPGTSTRPDQALETRAVHSCVAGT